MDPKSTTSPNPVSLPVEEELGLFEYLAEDFSFGHFGGKLRGCRMNLAGVRDNRQLK